MGYYIGLEATNARLLQKDYASALEAMRALNTRRRKENGSLVS